MSRTAKSTALAVLALLAALGMAGCTPSPDKDKPAAGANLRTEVQSLFEGYVDALNKSDSTAIQALYAPEAEISAAGREHFFRGREAIDKAAGESLSNPRQNTFDIDTLDVAPIEKAHALALVVYSVDPADQDIPAFLLTATYVLEKSGGKWRIVHAHLSPAREL